MEAYYHKLSLEEKLILKDYQQRLTASKNSPRYILNTPRSHRVLTEPASPRVSFSRHLPSTVVSSEPPLYTQEGPNLSHPQLKTELAKLLQLVNSHLHLQTELNKQRSKLLSNFNYA